MQKNTRLVYSTDKGKISEPVSPPQKPTTDGIIRLFKETKGRGGKCVTLIKGFDLSLDEISLYCKQLKQLCGTGGTQKDYAIEIQGDHRDKIKTYLETKGFKTKLAGG